MSGPILDALREQRIHVSLDGVQLRYAAVGRRLNDADLAQLRSQKVEILRALQDRMPASTDIPGYEEWFEERAAIMEFDAGIPRETAEILAEISILHAVGDVP